MNDVIVYDTNGEELKRFVQVQNNVIAKLSDEDWSINKFTDCKELHKFLEENKKFDFGCFEVKDEDGISAVVNARKQSDGALLLLITNDNVSPKMYMRPDIMAASLLIRPIKEDDIYAAVRSLVLILTQADGPAFVIHNKEGVYKVQHKNIVCFEAKQKKVFLRTEREEIGFYDTLDNVSKQLGNSFIRAHKGFLINSKRIERIIYNENVIYMDDKTIIPLSRMHKSAVKEMFR